MNERKEVVRNLSIIRMWGIVGAEDNQLILLRDHCVKMVRWTEDAIALLKAKTTMEVRSNGTTWWYQCSECHHPLSPGDNYCGGCGKKVRPNVETNTENVHHL